VPVTELSAAKGVPRSNLYYWQSRKKQIDAPEAVRDFFESAVGLEVLHWIYTAAMFAFVQRRGCGVDAVGEFLQLSRLDRFAAASHGSVYQQSGAMEREIVRYGRQERDRLASQMAPKRITVCEDETFHPRTCLVGIEAASGYILVEEYSEARDAKTWGEALRRAMEGMAAEVAAICSDEAKGLISHAHQVLGVPHCAELFHAQHEVSKATARPLAQRLSAPRKAVEEAERRTQRLREQKAAYLAGPRPPGRPPLFDRYIAAAEANEQAARDRLAAVEADREAVRAANRELSDAYHLVDLSTGQRQDDAAVETRMHAAFATIDEVAQCVGLSPKRLGWIDKARRLIPKFRSHVAFANDQLDRALEELTLAPRVLRAVNEQLVGGLYLMRAAARARSTEERKRLRSLAQDLLDAAHDSAGALAGLDVATREHIESTVNACLDLFVRSTACVEGRNGQLALRHHSLHRLSDQRLAAMTVIHNFHAQRADRSTAAERFFGQAPEPLFEWLVANLDPPPRPRSSRYRRAA
jgi:hypothetical protein